jgi:hypothetical protein
MTDRSTFIDETLEPLQQKELFHEKQLYLVRRDLARLEPQWAAYEEQMVYWADVQANHKKVLAGIDEEQMTLKAAIAEKHKSIKAWQYADPSAPHVVKWNSDPPVACQNAALAVLQTLGNDRQTTQNVKTLDFQSLAGPGTNMPMLKTLWGVMDRGELIKKPHFTLPDIVMNPSKTKLRCAEGIRKVDLAFYIVSALALFDTLGSDEDDHE